MQFTLFLPLSIGASVTQLTQIHAEDPKQDPWLRVREAWVRDEKTSGPKIIFSDLGTESEPECRLNHAEFGRNKMAFVAVWDETPFTQDTHLQSDLANRDQTVKVAPRPQQTLKQNTASISQQMWHTRAQASFGRALPAQGASNVTL